METLVDEHETWAKRTLAITILAAVAAVGSVIVGRWPRIARAVAVVAAVASAAAAYAVYETGHRGGALVYRHAAGVELAVTGPAAGPGPAVPQGDSSAPSAKVKDVDAD